MEETKNGIDEALYNRQLYVLDHSSMKRITESSVLLVGLGGVGVELAKNIILSGVKAVTLYDENPVTYFDLSSQFFLAEQHIGQPRARACFDKLAELNCYVRVSVHNGELSDIILKTFQVIVITEGSLSLKLKLNKFCRENGIKFLVADSKSVFGRVFCDFGDNFMVTDPNGEAPLSYMIQSVTQEKTGVVTIVEDVKLQFETGDYVSFSEVIGLNELEDGKPIKVHDSKGKEIYKNINMSQPKKITVLSPITFSIDDTSNLSPYERGGYVVQVKMPSAHSFLPFEESLQKPRFLEFDDTQKLLHLSFLALDHYQEKLGELPKIHNEEDAQKFLEIINELNKKYEMLEKLDEKRVKTFAHKARGSLGPVAAAVGGFAAQEVLKACSGKFTPLNQFLYFDFYDVLPEAELPAEDFQPSGNRYDAQTCVLGRTLHQSIQSSSFFLVGAGAIGCEMLKNWAMIGLGTKSCVHVTDMDVIEKSNLSRQFLFRNHDVQKLKSLSASEAVQKMNPEFKVKSYSLRVGAETEGTFNDEFYSSIDGVCNALDNLEARLYMDSQCIYHLKPMLESGTLGTKGHVQVVVPHKTESYGSSHDPPEKTFPQCTVRHFPNNIQHTLAWSKENFQELFTSSAENVNSFLNNPHFGEQLKQQTPGAKLEILNGIKANLVTNKPTTLENCVAWARLEFEELYCNNIKQLLFNFPADMITQAGVPFWSGPKRPPSPLVFDPNDDTHLTFVISAANLRAANYGIKGNNDVEFFKKELQNVIIPEFVPKSGLKIQTTENESQQHQQQQPEQSVDIDTQVQDLLKELPQPSALAGFKMIPAEFEKDDDSNFHVDYIHTASNLRAANYSIPQIDRHKSKGIAGKIIPAMVTTTAFVTGLACLELIKVIQKKGLDKYRNAFANLALPYVGFSEPIAPVKVKVRDDWSWTLWDRIEIKDDITLSQFLGYFQKKLKLQVSMMSSGQTLLFTFFMNKNTLAQRKGLKISELYQTVSQTTIPAYKKAIQLEVCVNNEDGTDVEIPWVLVRIKK